MAVGTLPANGTCGIRTLYPPVPEIGHDCRHVCCVCDMFSNGCRLLCVLARCPLRSGWRPLTVIALRAETSERTLRHWWEEKNHEDGVKWKFLEHRGPYFAPPYEPLPDDVNFYYDGQVMKLSPAAEEVATFYGKMLDHEYTTKEIFQNNFYTDWRTQMTKEEKKTIKHLHKCDFSEIHKYFFDKNEARKALPKEEKQKLKEEASALQEEYGYCMLDGHREKIGNFKIEPPGLFRGRGDHPKMGMLKLRIKPEDVIINCSSDSKVPEPPSSHRWKEVRFDNSVTWLASWTENIQGSIKYIMLNPSSKLKGEKDWQKYEIARRLKNVVDQIRSQYRTDWKSREMKKRQRAVALYFIDKLALRAGNEKEEGETADTVGCCSLRVEHIKLYPELDGQQHVVEFDFLGKDSIRYYNKVPVEKEVFKNLKRFMENKDPEDDVFDRLNVSTYALSATGRSNPQHRLHSEHAEKVVAEILCCFSSWPKMGRTAVDEVQLLLCN
ncbi:hypothetical protein GDO78_018474 [Eleutherodactylus coqui]|uniref:DNA topoisomerase n=1 Tax=Eleutherodactylus coqui TaxID=57060 RepID=A0A8J6EJR1_ELECQ|nr:hypothetical protein GDO78_018474 [Eleutherodactylus coqui]